MPPPKPAPPPARLRRRRPVRPLLPQPAGRTRAQHRQRLQQNLPHPARPLQLRPTPQPRRVFCLAVQIGSLNGKNQHRRSRWQRSGGVLPFKGRLKAAGRAFMPDGNPTNFNMLALMSELCGWGLSGINARPAAVETLNRRHSRIRYFPQGKFQRGANRVAGYKYPTYAAAPQLCTRRRRMARVSARSAAESRCSGNRRTTVFSLPAPSNSSCA